MSAPNQAHEVHARGESSPSGLPACASFLAGLGILLATANWAFSFMEDMHAYAILIVMISMGAAAGVAFTVLLELARRLALATGFAAPGARPLAVATGLVGPAAAALFVEGMMLLDPLPLAMAVQGALLVGIVAAAALGIPLLARRLEGTARLVGNIVSGAALIVVLGVAAAPVTKPGLPVGRPSGGPAHPRATGPNVILVSLDTVRPDHLSAYGYSRPTSPRIDETVREGVLFTQAISASSWTVLSHAALMTGASPSRIGPSLLAPASGAGVYLPDDAITLAETLRDRGYRTAAFIGGATMRSTFGFAQGFDVFDDMLPPALPSTADHFWLAPDLRRLAAIRRQDFLAFMDPFLRRLVNALYDQGFGSPPGDYARYAGHPKRFWNTVEEVNAKVAAWLDGAAPAPAPPTFLFVHYFDAHSPYDAPAPWHGRWGNDGSGLGYLQSTHLVSQVMRDGRVLTEREKGILIGSYDEDIAHMDAGFGALMEMLRGRGLLDDAIVVLFSDHGESFGEHEDLFHGHSLHEEQIRIVLSIRYPGRIGPGTRVDAQVRAVDIVPTILDLAGVDASPAGREGVSLAPLLAGKAQDPSAAFAFSELYARGMDEPSFGPFTLDHFCVRAGGWKFARDSSGARRLHNVAEDPGEKVDLVESDPERARDLEARLDGWLAAGFHRSGQEPVDPRRLEELKGLGYIDPD